MKSKIYLILISSILLSACAGAGKRYVLKSPSGEIGVSVTDSGLMVSYEKRPIQFIKMDITPVGKKAVALKTGDTPLEYHMLSGKRSDCFNVFRQMLLRCEGLVLNLRVFNDGVVLRKITDGTDPEISYIIPDGQKRWSQNLRTDYEGFYPMRTEARSGSYGYPLLTEYADGLFGLISESDVQHGMSGSHLEVRDDNAYHIKYMSEGESENGISPAFVLIIGSLADIVESTLVTDVATPCQIKDISWIHPGLSSWIYWAYNHSSKDFGKVKEYIDLAAEMRWPYTLIDWEWDEMAGGGDIEDAMAYAREKGVKVNLWYNSGTSWIGPGAPSPQDRLRTAEARESEMTRLENMGATGIKVDFFLPDGAEMIDYYLDILEDAARHRLLVNFHGCTVPRGWNRTWPNLMTMEAVYGAEWYNNTPRMTQAAASHNATLPFTRNVIGPMDYTPCTFSDSQHKHITTDCHELALPILFESGLQHMADRPESYMSLPYRVKDLLMGLPSAWDDTRLLAGYPGESAVIARRSGDRWYIAGINGTDEVLEIAPDFSRLEQKGKVTVFTDRGQEPGQGFEINENVDLPETFILQPRGGFVILADK